MSSHPATAYRRLPYLALLLVLAGCSGSDDRTASAPAEAKRTPAVPDVASPSPATMAPAALRTAAEKALSENRMYAPAGDNAIEYYLALHARAPGDPTAKSALTDLLPYAVIAAEQHLQREDFAEAQRLVALIEQGDPDAPALPRLQRSLATGLDDATQRTTAETEALRRQTEQRLQQLAEQQKQLQQRSRALAEAAQTQPSAAPVASAPTAPSPPMAPAEVPAALTVATPAAASPNTEARAATAPSLRAISTPAPRYPADALRAGTAGEVLVEFTVGTDGRVTQSRVVQSTPVRVFDREALNAVKRWRFEPLTAPITTRRTLAFDPDGDGG